jgi:hypothetical protein
LYAQLDAIGDDYALAYVCFNDYQAEAVVQSA